MWHTHMASHTIRPSDVIHTIVNHPWRLVTPVVVLTLLAFGYSQTRTSTWEASQALVVRDETGDRASRPGKFTHSDEMKTSQETILELVKSRNVLSKALAEVGPPADYSGDSPWPSANDVESLQSSVRITPPKGAEFGKTEVFYLKVSDKSPERATALASAVCHQLQTRFSELREAKARSAVDELAKAADLAKTDLATATSALSQIEEGVAGDLAELRILNESPSGESDLRHTITEVDKELRAFRATQTENEEYLKVLKAAANDPSELVASPSVLLKAQPGLGRLKDGLVDAQIKTGILLGTMSELHPTVLGAKQAEQAIRNQLHDEISVAIAGVEVDQRINADRIRALEDKQVELQARFKRLASVRAEYSNLVTATKNRSESLRSVEHELAEARASQAAARSASLINLVDAPNAGTRPVNPAASMILLGGIAGGFLLGGAGLLLSVQPAPVPTDDVRAEACPARSAPRRSTLSLRDALRHVSSYGLHTR
jgi:succinoglycan biosynthesis transport protein ExoP